ncbi:MAG: PKD domain-containing protein [Methanospirillum sp.]|nr:PKD domain-containing protein [Methanospirillum sp.]
MRCRWVVTIFVVFLIALIPVPTVADTGGTPGYGHVFPAPDPLDPIDVPDPFPASLPERIQTRLFPATAVPQPTFAPVNENRVCVAASDSVLTPPNGTQLYVCDGVDDEREINDAIVAARGGIVELLDGTFRCSDRITLQASTTLRGQGSANTTIQIKAKPGSTGYLPVSIGAPYVNVGGFTLRGNGFIMVTRSHVRVRDVHATSVDLDGNWCLAYGNGMFFVWVAPPVDVIDDVEFYACEAFNAHTHGFNMNQDYNDRVTRATTNIRFLDCRATGCGYGVAGDPGITDPTITSTNQSKSEWITGFDLHEWQDLVNCEVVNCVATDNWESGFHLEPGARYSNPPGPRTISKNIVFRNCISSNNGQRNTYADHFFMSGYYLSRDTHLQDCVSFNNRNCGYYVHGGANTSFEGCTDDGSTYGWKVCKASEEISIADCTCANNLRWALWLAFSRGIDVTGFRHTGVTSDRGFQSILGWYKNESAYQLPVTDSSFEITAVGNGMPIINEEGERNTYVLNREGTPTGDSVVAGFSATPFSGEAPLTVRFNDLSENATLRWWDLGDGNTSSERDPVHVYGAPGNYTIRLIAADNLRHDVVTRTDCISVEGPVTASFSATPTLVPVGAPVRFASTSGGNPHDLSWEFGDGGTSIEREPVHVYSTAGTFDVSLMASNTRYSDTRILPGLVKVFDVVTPSFTVDRTEGPAPLEVAFTDTSTGEPEHWLWDFGDGNTSVTQHPVHAYECPGNYTVTLTAGNAFFTNSTTLAEGVIVTAQAPSVTAVPGAESSPVRLGTDGLYDDVNGNGRSDFADVVLFFNQMAWIAENEPLEAFDFNGNGRIDFADVVSLFNRT